MHHQALEHFGIFENVQGFGIHFINFTRVFSKKWW